MSPYRPEILTIVNERERAERAKALRDFVGRAATEYKKSGVPLDSEGRIDMEAFGGLYSDMAEDRKATQERLRGWHPGSSEQEIREERLSSDGEQLELLTYATLQKNLGDKFIIARSSEHDDHINGVDQVLIERETGNIICAFDEIGDTAGVDYQRKVAAVRDHNVKGGGATLKYGLKLEDVGGKKKILPSEVRNVPILYVALPQDRIIKGLREFIPSPKEQSEFERKLFEYFMAAISLQVKGLELYGQQLNPDLNKRLAAFNKTIAGLSRKAT